MNHFNLNLLFQQYLFSQSVQTNETEIFLAIFKVIITDATIT